ncbi:uncharacterized protein LOC112018562 isoform X2 [Quercus suber]|uniref:uncharacterized protein LOC112018562 isoform X2 n=1 Tax=Quercus suber TaxID=58331 RepID=UPI0032DED1CB
MWRRKQSSSSTEVGCIACEELSLVGAGKEGWLVEDPNLVCALDTHALAIAHNSLILLLGFGSSSSSPDSRVNIRPDLSPIESEHITAIEWLVFEDYDIRVVVAGTSSGYLLFYSLLGHFIHKQMIHPGRILKLRVRGTKRDLTQDTTSSEEVCVVMPGIVARFDGSHIQSMLRQWFEETHTQYWEQKPKKRGSEGPETPYGRLPFQLWNVSKYGTCADAAITGIMPPPLMELQLLLLLGSQVSVITVRLLLERMLLFRHSGFQKTKAGL